MRLFELLSKSKSTLDTQAQFKQEYKHNLYDATISQYSQLPRYYYILGKRYDIDSPESVSSIPLCETSFKINDDNWGIDTVLREHVNRYYSHIPDALREECYSKISELKDNGFYIKSSAEKRAIERQKQEQFEKEQQLMSITKKDMEQFNLEKFELIEPLFDNRISIMGITELSKLSIQKDIELVNKYIFDACKFANIKYSLHIDPLFFKYDVEKLDRYGVNQYYTFFECNPYTKTGKTSKFPLILHYAIDEETFGQIYYLQDGTIGKCRLIFWIEHIMYSIELGLKGTTIVVKKVEQGVNGVKNILFKE